MNKEDLLIKIQDRCQACTGKLYLQVLGRDLEILDKRGEKSDFSFDFWYCIEANELLTANYDILGEIEQSCIVFEQKYGVKPQLVITGVNQNERYHRLFAMEGRLQRAGIRVWEHYASKIQGAKLRQLFSENALGNNDHIPSRKKLILMMEYTKGKGVFGCGISQLFCDWELGIDSSFAVLNLQKEEDLGKESDFDLLLQEEFAFLKKVRKYLGSEENPMMTYQTARDLVLG